MARQTHIVASIRGNIGHNIYLMAAVNFEVISYRLWKQQKVTNCQYHSIDNLIVELLYLNTHLFLPV